MKGGDQVILSAQHQADELLRAQVQPLDEKLLLVSLENVHSIPTPADRQFPGHF
jgi:hypothetical protein